ncbi:hypothetical protein GCM10025771_29280 [Niveibacterium umoris]|uniref:Cytochrome C n=1 Tax=Niveibacterium umoris TaxID=1193620 RepID=A0A840BJY3_9RHOO|nr:cytochrome C [Niveibacterium umoris]MBB4011879.1 hypothetical protein [Niveibacterium umoris]
MRALLLLFALWLCGAAHAESIEKAIMPGELAKAHAKIEEECSKCHQRFDRSAQDRLCQDCHKDIRKDIAGRQGFHGHLDNTTCRTCHTDHKGRGASLIVIDTKKFDHAKTGFQLKGKHADIATKCASCHVAGKKYRDADTACASCHRKDDVHKTRLGEDCQRCHTEKNWKETSFDHEKTKFSLVGGKHAEVKCKSCHVDQTFKGAETQCNACHKKTDDEKGHKGRFGTKCETCHTDRGWKDIKFDHDTDTHYLLKGKHRAAKCVSCHLPEKGSLYQQKLPTKCVACHKADDDEKGHKGKLGDKCESCHNERGWKTGTFDHDTTHFPLRGGHRETKCEACHIGGVSGNKANVKLDTACVSCHRKDDQSKGHKGRYGDRCETCHADTKWKDARFDHSKTAYPLRGKHLEVRCDACHLVDFGPLKGSKIQQTCFACHQKDDKHKGQLGKDCAKCHDERRWQGTAFDHARSRFPLVGSHTKVDCAKCHTTPAFRDAPSACIGCHERDDVHKKRFGTRCETCHSARSWAAWDFDHASTGFLLDGGHAKVQCDTCHEKEMTGKATRRPCVACHTRDDVHEGGFGAQCDRCHVTANWKRQKR